MHQYPQDPILATMEKQATETFRGATKSYNSWLKQKAKIHWVDSNTIQRIKALSGFSLGRLPFTYLGIPMSPKQIHPSDCEKLTDKMCARIKMWSSRNLSYAGRLQLVNSVLMTISSIGVRFLCSSEGYSGHHRSLPGFFVAWDIRQP
ncbi:hypothetical protein RDABS01_003823 [Bienertia sinuspersici]